LSKKKTFGEKVDEQLGKLLFLYYRYLKNFNRAPIDFDDMIDGIIYLALDGGIDG
jgi:hypothetical protein